MWVPNLLGLWCHRVQGPVSMVCLGSGIWDEKEPKSPLPTVLPWPVQEVHGALLLRHLHTYGGAEGKGEDAAPAAMQWGAHGENGGHRRAMSSGLKYAGHHGLLYKMAGGSYVVPSQEASVMAKCLEASMFSRFGVPQKLRPGEKLQKPALY